VPAHLRHLVRQEVRATNDPERDLFVRAQHQVRDYLALVLARTEVMQRTGEVAASRLQHIDEMLGQLQQLTVEPAAEPE
jgi:hypothetical protein